MFADILFPGWWLELLCILVSLTQPLGAARPHNLWVQLGLADVHIKAMTCGKAGEL